MSSLQLTEHPDRVRSFGGDNTTRARLTCRCYWQGYLPKEGTDHEGDSCNLRPRLRIHHWHGSGDGYYCHRLIQAALADNERREIVRNREARHALALSVAGASAVIVFWLATLLFY